MRLLAEESPGSGCSNTLPPCSLCGPCPCATRISSHNVCGPDPREAPLTTRAASATGSATQS